MDFFGLPYHVNGIKTHLGLPPGASSSIIADLDGAVDATWCKGLICKLYHPGIKGGIVILLNNFLTYRMSRSNVSGYASEGFPTTMSLPQGSTLSPIVFLVYSGHLSADPKKSCLFDNYFFLTSETTNKNDVTPLNESKFADDYHFWRRSSNITDLKSPLQSDLKMINCCCHEWRINLNLKKTNVLLFNGQHKGNQRKYLLKLNKLLLLKYQRKGYQE